ncbi:btb poz domain protein [Teratosphaeria destructans]|uniref:Btb poz domain protein n=1 Tax=Teratosphaeria destructans TaxID=418781 RepID=A0A9W7W2E3_9PEZI|nr:btb poz domain protein [Teratosphaeria destructans]
MSVLGRLLIVMRSIVLLVAIFFSPLATSQSPTCYYPDGQTIASNHTACSSSSSSSGPSACCASDAFCLENGFCFADGVVSRGSCTDRSWNDSTACASACLSQDPSTDIAISPCTTSQNATFVCGLNATDCSDHAVTFTMTGSTSGLVLRPSQVEALLSSVIAPSNATHPPRTYTTSDMASLGCGLGLPLSCALALALFLLHKEKARHAPPKLMYPLPDDCKDDYRFQPAPPLSRPYTAESQHTHASSRPNSASSPVHAKAQGEPGTFLERYKAMQATDKFVGTQRHELDTLAPQPRYELGDHRFSKG